MADNNEKTFENSRTSLIELIQSIETNTASSEEKKKMALAAKNLMAQIESMRKSQSNHINPAVYEKQFIDALDATTEVLRTASADNVDQVTLATNVSDYNKKIYPLAHHAASNKRKFAANLFSGFGAFCSLMVMCAGMTVTAVLAASTGPFAGLTAIIGDVASLAAAAVPAYLGNKGAEKTITNGFDVHKDFVKSVSFFAKKPESKQKSEPTNNKTLALKLGRQIL